MNLVATYGVSIWTAILGLALIVLSGWLAALIDARIPLPGRKGVQKIRQTRVFIIYLGMFALVIDAGDFVAQLFPRAEAIVLSITIGAAFVIAILAAIAIRGRRTR